MFMMRPIVSIHEAKLSDITLICQILDVILRLYMLNHRLTTTRDVHTHTQTRLMNGHKTLLIMGSSSPEAVRRLCQHHRQSVTNSSSAMNGSFVDVDQFTVFSGEHDTSAMWYHRRAASQAHGNDEE